MSEVRWPIAIGGVLCMSLAANGCSSQKLTVVHAGMKQGNLSEITCSIAGWETPQAPYIAVSVRTSCVTIPKVWVHVFARNKPLSSREIATKLELPPPGTPNFMQKLESAPFADVGKGTMLSVVVFSHCEVKDEPISGEASCRMP